jgi:hypothetical protein
MPLINSLDLDEQKLAIIKYTEHHNYLISVFEQEIHELSIRLSMSEDEDYCANEWVHNADENEMCYYCGNELYNCICGECPTVL